MRLQKFVTAILETQCVINLRRALYEFDQSAFEVGKAESKTERVHFKFQASLNLNNGRLSCLLLFRSYGVIKFKPY